MDAAEAAEAEQAEPIAGPSGLCGQRLGPAPSQDLVFADAMEEVCTILIFVNDFICSRSWSLCRCIFFFFFLVIARQKMMYWYNIVAMEINNKYVFILGNKII